jgi:hypothetical protein
LLLNRIAAEFDFSKRAAMFSIIVSKGVSSDFNLYFETAPEKKPAEKSAVNVARKSEL